MRSMLARRRTELAFADAEDLVTLGKCEVQFVIYHYHVILSHPLESGTQSVKAIGNGRIVLDVAVAVKVRCKFLRSLAHKYVVDEIHTGHHPERRRDFLHSEYPCS